MIVCSLILISVSCQSQNDTALDNKDMEIVKLVSNNDIAKVKQALAEGADVNAVNSNNEPLVLMASRSMNFPMAELLVNNAADVNKQGNNLDSAFLYAGASGQTQMVELFLNNGARFDVYNRYYGSALIPASEKGHVETVRLLANWPDYPIDHVNKLGWTAAMEAVVLGDGGKAHQEIIQILKDAGADMSITDSKGVSILEHAQQRGFTEIIEILQN